MSQATTRTGTLRRAVAGATLLLGTVALPSAIVASTAEAGTISTGAARVRPITWVDPQGRQHVVTDGWNGDFQHPVFELTAARDLPTGAPDPSWGPGGRKAVVLTPPAAGLVRERVVTATDAGSLATTWVPEGCNPATTACDRWFQRFTVDGTTVGTPAHATTDDRPSRPLPDGSFLTTDPAGAIGWWGPDGTDRGAPALAAADLDDVTVDRAGRLLVANDTHQVVRWPAGGPATVVATVAGCRASAPIALGRSVTENGFATACAYGVRGQLTVQRHTSTGAVAWSTTATGTDPSGVLTDPQTALLDDLGRVWLGGTGLVDTDGPSNGLAMAQAWSSAGPGEIGYRAWIPSFSTYDTGRAITELRPAPAHRVGVADEERCCLTSDGTYPQDSVHSAVAPSPVATATAVAPFTSVGAFVRRQYLDLVGSVPAGEPGTSATAIAQGRIAPASFVAKLLRSGRGARQVEPMYRLYRAYFERTPDISGLRHYVGLLRSGTPLATISREFAASSEFTRRYGSLDDGAFLRQVYRNVFRREGDAAGLDYWYRQLQAHRTTRGGVVLRFSESSEHVRLLSTDSQTVAATFLMLDRRPSDAETFGWRYRPEVRRTAAEAILPSAGYAARVG